MCVEKSNFFKENPTINAFFLGSFSGSISAILLQPLDVVKTRLQNPSQVMKGSSEYQGMSATFLKIVQKERLRGLWKGTIPSLTRSVPGVGLYFSSLHYMRTQFLNDRVANPFESIIMGIVARSFAEATLMPITVIKTRFESGIYAYKTIFSALKEIVHNEGIKGMARGLTPSLFRDAPFSGLYFMFYTQSKLAVPNEWMTSVYASPIHFLCACTASFLATLVTQPPDIIKTKMQLHPEKFPGIWPAIKYIKFHYGFAGFFKGIFPRMLRRALVAGISWTVYERFT
ncbi:mitochondrial glycine transporter isoform X1 [Leptinotarsa decemlineata]|uniref:mitochondrial glycine transporter isoform X1 n=2 Tax=Leptinotarsa decemlineata TaxID=7539 RepID=UPI003D3090E9